jgi:hypothetical protein
MSVILPPRYTKFLGLKAMRLIAALQVSEDEALITIVTCKSPGHFPSVNNIPLNNMKIHLLDPLMLAKRVQTDVFTGQFRHFISNVKSKTEDPVIPD